MPRVMKRNAPTVATRDAAPEYSDACRRVLEFTPEQFVAAVDARNKPVLLSKEENLRLTLAERAAVARHVAELLDGFAKIKGWVKGDK